MTPTTPTGSPSSAAPWGKGRLVIERLIEEGRLDTVVPDESVVQRQMAYAAQHLSAAREQVDRFPLPAFTSAYDAARLMMSAVLERQGLRLKAEAAHLTVEEATSAQISEAVGRKFRAIRLLRHASEYPAPGKEGADEDAAREAVLFAETLQTAVTKLLPNLGVFSPPATGHGRQQPPRPPRG